MMAGRLEHPHSMSAEILQFRLREAGSFSAGEIVAAQDWVSSFGPAWNVSRITEDTGGVGLGVVTPSSLEEPEDGPADYAWHMVREGGAVVLITTRGHTSRAYPTLGDALMALLAAETARFGKPADTQLAASIIEFKPQKG